MPSQNTLELAKRGEPEAIATILTYYLMQRYNTTASVIRLGNYLSVLIDVTFAADQVMLVSLVLEIVRLLRLKEIDTIEISARRLGDRKVLWSQTIELVESRDTNLIMNDEFTPSTSQPVSVDFETTTQATATQAIPQDDANPSTLAEPTATPSVAMASTEMEKPAPAIAAVADTSEDTTDEWGEILKKLIDRPEMLAIVVFALMVALWDTYADWLSEIELNQPISGVKLARRLGISNSTLSRHKLRPNFSEWSQDLDPDGIAWVYEGKAFIAKVG